MHNSSNSKTPLNYTRIMVMVHGKSELQIAGYIKSKLKIPMIENSRSSGKNNIEITEIPRELNSEYLTFNAFKKMYKGRLEIIKDKKTKKMKIANFKLFIIMDTDNCSEEVRKNFINKSMFKGHWLYDYIVPIYNIEKLEDVLKKAGIKYANTKTEKGNYVKIFPKDHKKIIANQDIKDIEEFEKKLEMVDDTNMDIFIKYCLEIERECNH